MSRTRIQFATAGTIVATLVALAALALSSATFAAAGAAASATATAGHASAAANKAAPVAAVELVDINSASRAQLKTLPGIGDAEADRIIAARPYLSKAELVTKNVMATGPYLSIKSQIVAKQKRPPQAKP